ncbi:MAG: hypothetical protein R3B59_03465 [Dehalococcoidia bacterium]
MTNEDPIRRYLDAKRAFDEQTDRCRAHRDTIKDINNLMTRWWDMRFSNLDIGFPAGAAQLTFDAHRWPDLRRVAQDLADWHQLRHQLSNAWALVPEGDRGGLQAPPPTPQW